MLPISWPDRFPPTVSFDRYGLMLLDLTKTLFRLRLVAFGFGLSFRLGSANGAGRDRSAQRGGRSRAGDARFLYEGWSAAARRAANRLYGR